MEVREFRVESDEEVEEAAGVWTGACGAELGLSARAVAYNVWPTAGGRQAGLTARLEGQMVGFVLASTLKGQRETAPEELGWIDALAVRPEARLRGVGSGLLEWAEEWLAGQGCTRVRLGGSLRPFAPGVPLELGNAGFFWRRGYTGRGENDVVWDMALDLMDYDFEPPRVEGVKTGPATRERLGELHTFLAREFPGRWRYELEQHRRDGGRPEDYWMLESERGIEACCLTTREDSARPVEHFYPAPLARPWGQAGSIGVSADRRGVGYGTILLDAALRGLRANGVRGCVIDWTHLTEYYARFGFHKHRAYGMMGKKLRNTE